MGLDNNIEKILFLTNINRYFSLVPWVSTTATWACARASGAGFDRPVRTPLLALVKGLRDPATMPVEQGGGREIKRTGSRDVKTAGRTAGPSGAGERGATTKNTLLLGGRVEGHVQLYRERGRREGAEKRDRYRKNQEVNRASGCSRQALVRCTGAACLTRRRTQDQAGTAESRGKSSVGRRHAPGCLLVMPADKTTDSRRPQGAPSPLPLHPG